MFVDEVSIQVNSGSGGPGCMSFHRERHMPKGGPDGGDGGKGGGVHFRVNDSLTTLYHLQHKKIYNAKNGLPGEGKRCFGKKGEDLVIDVPRGTVIREKGTGDLIVDFNMDLDRWHALDGGKGGRGNWHFKSSINQTPREFEKGLPGETLDLELSLKLIADVGLVGFPNAGKSSLLSRLSSARPKVAAYPFTTLTPHLGTYSFDATSQIVFADIPGLIEGASDGKGLGHKFLKHIERTKILVHLVEPYSTDGVGVVERVKSIREELHRYSDILSNKKEILVLSKADLRPDPNEVSEWQKELGEPLICLSSASGEGVEKLMHEINEVLMDLED